MPRISCFYKLKSIRLPNTSLMTTLSAFSAIFLEYRLTFVIYAASSENKVFTFETFADFSRLSLAVKLPSELTVMPILDKSSECSLESDFRYLEYRFKEESSDVLPEDNVLL